MIILYDHPEMSDSRKIRNYTIHLPASKSVAARMLVIDALTKKPMLLRNLPHNDDIRNLMQALQVCREGGAADAGDSGTAWRFLTAVASTMENRDILLKGSARLKQRPLMPLVQALRGLGADIVYNPAAGITTPFIRGKKLKGGRVMIDATMSSQFISALMMIGPLCQEPLSLILEGDRRVSFPYVMMTANIMERFGVKPFVFSNRIEVPLGEYSFRGPIRLEADWSSAAYFYEALAIIGHKHLGAKRRINLRFNLLTKGTSQADEICRHLFEPLGIKTGTMLKGLEISYSPSDAEVPQEYDMMNCPDLVPAFAVAMALTGHKFKFRGISHLRYKESNRIDALTKEMAKIGILLTSDHDTLCWDGTRLPIEDLAHIDCHNDHRIAMAMAPAAVVTPLLIDDPAVVSKSFPDFFLQLSGIGFSI